MKNSERLALVQPKPGWHRRVWTSSGIIRRFVLVGWFASVLVSNALAGWGLIVGGVGAYVSTVVLALILGWLFPYRRSAS